MYAYLRMKLSGYWCYILICIDDILIAANSKQEILEIENNMEKSNNLEEVKHYIGIKIEKDHEENISISQKNYI